MTGNHRGGFTAPPDEELLAMQPLADEIGWKRKPDRLVITGSPFGPQLMRLYRPEEDEAKDPNP